MTRIRSTDAAVRRGARFGRAAHRAAGVVIVCTVALSTLAMPVDASVAPDGQSAEAEVRRESDFTPGLEGSGVALWFWPEGRRAYQTLGRDLVAYDLDTQEMVAQQPADLWDQRFGGEPYSGAKGRHHVATVDRVGGRVFAVYSNNPEHFIAFNATERDPADAACPSVPLAYFAACAGGVGVFSGAELQPLGKMPLSLPSVTDPRAYVIPRALSYAPAVPDRGWGGQVLMVVEEIAHSVATEHGLLPNLSASAQLLTPRRNGGAISYAVAFDPDSMRQVWAVRLEGCRNSREPRNWLNETESYPTAIFRAAGPEPAVYVGCHGNASQQGVVVRVPLDDTGTPAPLPVRIGDPAGQIDGGIASPTPDTGVAELAPRQEVYAGPERTRVIIADPVSQRLLLRVDDSGEVWWIFDGTQNQYIGTVGIGGYFQGHTSAGLDPDTGRLYVLAAKPTEANAPGTGGLYIADIRRSPLPQALVYPELADRPRAAAFWLDAGGTALSVLPRAGTGSTRLFVSKSLDNLPVAVDGKAFAVIVDETDAAAPEDAAGEEAIVRSLDIQERDGVTDATFDGTARGFAFRAMLLGGVEGAARAGTADPLGVARGVWHLEGYRSPEGNAGNVGIGQTGDLVRRLLPPPDPCADAQRELIAAFVGPRGPAVVDASSARGESQALVVDTRSRSDLEQPVTRCGPETWEGTWTAGMFSQPPMSEPDAWPFGDNRAASCTAVDEEVEDSVSDPVFGMFASSVRCSADEASGWGQARGVGVEGVSVANALASFRIYRDLERGLVARVESVARGVDVGGVLKIDTIRGVAESWANGHRAEAAADSGASLSGNPFNCDVGRPAGTCFQRHVFGVAASGPGGGPGYRCGPCGDEDALIEGINRGLGSYASARFREPDPELARGSEDGYVAAVTKKSTERFSDIVLNGDLLETMVPMLEIIRYAPHGRPNNPGGQPAYSFGTPPRGRQVYQFAGVEVSSTYSIQCLLVYDEASNTCAAPAEPSGSIQVSLSDSDGAPLAGGAFEVRADVDADGVLGLKDTLLPGGACVTAADGVGTCELVDLAPGAYLVGQVAAPPGYAKSAEPFVVELASGERRTVAFTNVSNLSMVDVKATDENGAPLAGAAFAAYPDPDADGKVAPEAKPAADCTTDARGACQMKVPAGSYVLVQTTAPGRLEGIEPVAFTFATGGQVASVSVVNYPPETPAAPGPTASPEIGYTPPVDQSPPSEIVDDGYVAPTDTGLGVVEEPEVSVPERVGGTVTQVIRAPGDALRLLARDPEQAIAWTAALALFVLAAMAVQRRSTLASLGGTVPPALTGGAPGRPPSRPGAPGSPAGPSRPPGSSSGGGPAGRAGSRQAGGSHRSTAGGTGGASQAMTAVLDRPVVTGAAPSVGENVVARVVLGVLSDPLKLIVRDKLAGAGNCEVLAVTATIDGLRDAIRREQPDVVVVDLGLLDGAAINWDRLADLHAPDRIVGLIPPEGSVETAAVRAYRAGIAGLLVAFADTGNGQLSYAVRCVASGKPFYGPTVQAIMRDQGASQRRRGRTEGLTPRELEVARLAATGMKRNAIAQELYLSPLTVKRHLHSVRSKLGVTNPWDLEQLRRRLEERQR